MLYAAASRGSIKEAASSFAALQPPHWERAPVGPVPVNRECRRAVLDYCRAPIYLFDVAVVDTSLCMRAHAEPRALLGQAIVFRSGSFAIADDFGCTDHGAHETVLMTVLGACRETRDASGPAAICRARSSFVKVVFVKVVL